MTFPNYDPRSDSIRLEGGAAIVLNLLMKAKFGAPFDPETLFHPELSNLIEQLRIAAGRAHPAPGECFGRGDLWRIAEHVFDESVTTGWWAMTVEDKNAFLQRAAAPWILSDEQLGTIMEDVEDMLFRRRQVLSAAEMDRR